MFKITSLALLFALGSFATMATGYNDTMPQDQEDLIIPPAPESSTEIDDTESPDSAPITQAIAPVTEECDA